MHTSRLEVRFHELDPYGHVNHALYLSYFETARIEALVSIGCGLERLQADGFHLIVVEANIRYVRPSTFGNLLTVESQIVETRLASARWHQRITRDGELIATLDTRGAFTNRAGRPERIPEHYLALLGPLLAEA